MWLMGLSGLIVWASDVCCSRAVLCGDVLFVFEFDGSWLAVDGSTVVRAAGVYRSRAILCDEVLFVFEIDGS